ncbi:hypothetical protein P9J64_03690 [Deltaproteobacteria bacterium IMCC39524]|nr:hypothetical protein [Deltaproteobacteria bacterium IMCC39524]
MSSQNNKYIETAKKLYSYIEDNHWDGHVLTGPDPVGKIHWRVTRFARSYLSWLPFDDRYRYLQAQAYWIRNNIALAELTGKESCMDMINRCADYIVEDQLDSGAWLHPPIRFRKGFISTVEGSWAGLGLISAFKKTGKLSYLEAAQKWFDYQINQSGFQHVGAGLAANYYSHSTVKVPNVTTKVIWLAEELFQVSGDPKYLEYNEKMIRFIADSQLESGELPYELERIHFMCYQYNAFQFMDLANYYTFTSDSVVRSILEKLARFLSSGVTEKGHCRFNCFKIFPEVNYWTTALAAALRQAHQLGLGDYLKKSERCFEHALTHQSADGGFSFSRKSYGALTDRRSYPRYLSMILNHLLYRASLEGR